MRSGLIAAVVGIVLLAICCAGPFVLVGLGATAALAIAGVQPAIVVGALAIVALVGAGFAFRARRSKTHGDVSVEKR